MRIWEIWAAWDDALAERLTGLDILLIPVGGYYTIDAQSAAALCHRVQPRMIIPMHYRTQANADWPIAPVEDFLSPWTRRMRRACRFCA